MAGWGEAVNNNDGWGAVALYSFRVTENDDTRITEEGDTRITHEGGFGDIYRNSWAGDTLLEKVS